MDREQAATQLLEPILGPLAERLPDDARADLEASLRGEAKLLLGPGELSEADQDSLRQLLSRRVELEVLAAPAAERAGLLESWAAASRLEETLRPLGLASRDLLRAARAPELSPAAATELRERAGQLFAQVSALFRDQAPPVRTRCRPTGAIILLNCATVMSDGLLAMDGGVL